MQSAGVKNLGGTESNKAIDDAVNNANAECVARSQAAGQSDPQCRLVSVGFVHTPGSSGDWYTGANGSLTAKQWQGRVGVIRHSEQHLQLQWHGL